MNRVIHFDFTYHHFCYVSSTHTLLSNGTTGCSLSISSETFVRDPIKVQAGRHMGGRAPEAMTQRDAGQVE